ncbi:MAG: efflux RND transporter periplasmic adaptor subunit [Bacteroidia bacterium]|nr:efflux RND transporter periplasmic adaptor subunit [Bacteroidia bacterium]
MKKSYLYAIYLSLGLLAACGGAANDLEKKKEDLVEKRKQVEKLNAEIAVLEKEIASVDPDFVKKEDNTVLVTTLAIKPQTFTSYIEVQGEVESDRNVVITSEINGVVRRVHVSEGQAVAAGQLLISQDSEVIRRSIDEVKTSMELAETIFERQSRLWEQKIGTEIQYLEAKNNVERLKRQLQTLQAQQNQANITAPFAGVVDEIVIRQGQNAGPGSELLRLVSSGVVNVVADVSEEYLSKVNVGDRVTVEFPSLEMSTEAPITLIGQTINPDNRTFRIEIAMANPSNRLKPDLLARVKIKEFQQPDALVIPVSLIQRDKIGDLYS